MAMTLAENRADLFRTGCFGALSTVSGPWKPRTGKRGGQGDRHFQIAARGAKIISASGRPCGLGIRAACRDTLRLVIPWFERIRVQLSAAHEKHHLDKAIAAFTKVGKALGVLK